MFSVVPVILFTGGPNVTITYDALDPPGHQTWYPSAAPPPDIRPGIPSPSPAPNNTWDPLLVISVGHHWSPFQTCSFEACSYRVVAIEPHMVGVSGRYASYWNAFLFSSNLQHTTSQNLQFKF